MEGRALRGCWPTSRYQSSLGRQSARRKTAAAGSSGLDLVECPVCPLPIVADRVLPVTALPNAALAFAERGARYLLGIGQRLNVTPKEHKAARSARRSRQPTAASSCPLSEWWTIWAQRICHRKRRAGERSVTRYAGREGMADCVALHPPDSFWLVGAALVAMIPLVLLLEKAGSRRRRRAGALIANTTQQREQLGGNH